MLRSSLRHASIYQWILADGNCEKLVYPFLDGYVHNPNFDISSDALETVRVRERELLPAQQQHLQVWGE